MFDEQSANEVLQRTLKQTLWIMGWFNDFLVKQHHTLDDYTDRAQVTKRSSKQDLFHLQNASHLDFSYAWAVAMID